MERSKFFILFGKTVENRVLNPHLKKRCGLCSISKIYSQCFSDQNLCFDSNLSQLTPVNLALVNMKEKGGHAKQGLALLCGDGLGQGSYLTRLDAEMFLEMFLDILVGIVLLCQLLMYGLADFFEVIFSWDNLYQDTVLR